MRLASILLLVIPSCGRPEPRTAAPPAPPPPPRSSAPATAPSASDPLDLSFEAPLDPAVWPSKDPAITIDHREVHGGSGSLRIRATPDSGDVHDARVILPLDRVRGHWIQFGGWVRTRELIGSWAGLLCRVQGPDQASYGRVDTFDRKLAGSTDWTQVAVKIAVPPSAAEVTCSAVVVGIGELWLDDAALEIGAAMSEEQYRAPVAVDGVVLDAARRPLAGMTVRATMATDDRAVLVGAPSIAGSDGRFHLEVPAGDYELAATSPEITAGVLTNLTVERLTPRTGVELIAGGPGHTVSGRVRDLHGQPAAGALAGAFQVFPTPRDALLLVKADARGDYRLRVPPGSYIPLALDDDGLRLARPPVQVTADRRIHIELARRAELAEAPPAAVSAWLRRAAVPLAGVQAGQGFDDLLPLGRMIGKARLVAVGEATHGTREFSQMKHRILEYLVSQLGFSVFLMEAGVGEAAALDDYIMTGRGEARTALRTAVYRIWHTEELLAMAEWMRAWNADPAHTTKLRVYGIDVQTPTRALVGALSYLERVDPATAARTRDQLAPMRTRLSGSDYRALPVAARTALHDGLRDLLARFDSERAAWSRATSQRDWLIARKSLDVLRQNLATLAPPRGELANDQRDKGMAENAAWVLDQAEPGARAMLWAHNGHIARCGYDGTISVGQRLAQQRSRDYVAFGLVWNQGGFGAVEYGGPWAHEVGPEAPGGLGATFAQLGVPQAAFDLRAAPRGLVASWLAAPHRMRDIGALFTNEDHMDEVTRLSACFDVALFIDRTSAARPL